MKHIPDYSHLSSIDLASSILTHVVKPESGGLPATTFTREILDQASGRRPPNSLELIHALNSLNDYDPITPSQKDAISHGLEVTSDLIETLKMIRRLENKVDAEIPPDEKPMPVDLTGTALIRALDFSQQAPSLAEQVDAQGVYADEESDPADAWKQQEKPAAPPIWARKHEMVAEESAKITNLEDIQLMLRALAAKENIDLIEPPQKGSSRA